MTPDLPLVRRWQIFMRERFPLASHLPMALLFAVVNMGLAARCAAPGALPSPSRAALGLLLAFGYLFRLRCFDEIKNYATDLAINPRRPLPRGILSVRQVKGMIAALAVGETAIAAGVGWPVVASHLCAIGYSFLMYREFFIGDYLRPRLTAYAVTHTFSSVLLGWSLVSLALHTVAWRLPAAVLLFGLANWMLFNVFEFARKSFAREEEAPGVDSYTTLYGPWGAVALTLSQVVMAVWVVGQLSRTVVGQAPLWAEITLAGVLLLAGGIFALRPQRGPANAYRATASVFLLLFYAILLWGIWRG